MRNRLVEVDHNIFELNVSRLHDTNIIRGTILIRGKEVYEILKQVEFDDPEKELRRKVYIKMKESEF